MQLRPLRLTDVLEIVPVRHEDDRGYFSETFRRDWFDGHIGPFEFVQENQSLSRKAGTIRGLHFQTAPSAQGKLVRCVAGAILDVAVDIRHGSITFGQWVAATLSAEEGNQLWIPEGFLHGFCTLVPDTIISYKVTAYYDKAADAGVLWDDPEIGVTWPDIADPGLLSPKDKALPRLKDLPPQFPISGEVQA